MLQSVAKDPLFRDLFRAKSTQIISCIATFPQAVADALYGDGLIPTTTKNKIVLAKADNPYDTASQLMVAIQLQSNGFTDPDNYLIDVCHTLRRLEHQNKKLADIADSLLTQHQGKSCKIQLTPH